MVQKSERSDSRFSERRIQGLFIYLRKDLRKEIQMKKYFKSIIAVVAIITMVAGFTSCSEGPLERAGKKVDRAVDDIKK
jgi:hypothetical protein